MKENGHEVDHVSDILLKLMCDNPRDECYFQTCRRCPSSEDLEHEILTILKSKGIDRILYQNWIQIPKSTLEKKDESVEEFSKKFCEMGKRFLSHDFIASQQATSFKQMKREIQENECVVICDFAENFAFVVQNAIPGFHWNNNQATLFPIVFYYRESSVIKHKTLIIISDCMKHDAVAVHVFLNAFNDFLSSFRPSIRRCLYFSDGPSSQFKNIKHFSTIYHHQLDFNRSAVWNFYATAHGKGPCDGAGGSFKDSARRASLQMTEDSILSAQDLYNWANKDENVPSISVMYRSTEDYANAEKKISLRIQNYRTISGCMKFHYIEPIENHKLKVKLYSGSDAFEEVSLLKSQKRGRRAKEEEVGRQIKKCKKM